jgi:hypothetical protein
MKHVRVADSATISEHAMFRSDGSFVLPAPAAAMLTHGPPRGCESATHAKDGSADTPAQPQPVAADMSAWPAALQALLAEIRAAGTLHIAWCALWSACHGPAISN